jgi:hypothetical protein
MREKFYTDINEIVIFCDITTWMGTSIGAQHYYGKIKYKPYDGGFEEELSIRLTQRAAIQHNKGLRRFGRPSSEYVKAGELTANFMDKETLRETAIKCFHNGQVRDRWDEKDVQFPAKAVFLIEGNTGYAQPQAILACKPGLERQMEQLNELFDAGDGWYWEKGGDSGSRLDNLSSQWYRIMEKIKHECL